LCAYASNAYRVSLADVRLARQELDRVERVPTWLESWGLRARQLFAGDRLYWCLGTIIVLEIIALIWLSRAFV
jgi:hypothetical protein